MAKAAGLGLDQATLSWLVAIAGPRYDAASGQLKLSSEFHPTGAANKRAVLETMVALVQEAKGLGDKHGALPTKKVMPKYAHA